MVSGFLCVNSSRPSALPRWALGRAPQSMGAMSQPSLLTSSPGPLILPSTGISLKKKNVLFARQRSHLAVELRSVGRGGQARSEGHQGHRQKQQCQRKGPNQGVVSSGENFQLGFVKSREVLMPMAGFRIETQLSPGGGGRQSRL